MVPLVGDGAWSQALGPTHFSWMFLDEHAQGPAARHAARRVVRLPHQPGDLVLGHGGAGREDRRASRSSSRFAYTRDETNHFADMLLPDATDLESLQLMRIGGTKYIEQFWDHQGFALRQPVVAPRGEARDFTEIATELARRTGLLEQLQRGHQQGRRRRAAEERARRLLARPGAQPQRAKRSGTPCAGRRAPK